MLKRFRKLLEKSETPDAAGKTNTDDLRLAAAALLVEAARMDENFDDAERAAIKDALERRFELSGTEAEALLAEGEAAQDAAVDLYKFARSINAALAPEDRRQVIEMLWEVVYADGSLDHYEASLIRKLSGLLHVPDSESAEARQRVLANREAGT